jgi:hypothetical protein
VEGRKSGLHVARRLVSRGAQSLEEGARALTSGIFAAKTAEAKFSLVCGEWGFRLPTGSPLLTVCCPTLFSVYDARVCDQLDDFTVLTT